MTDMPEDLERLTTESVDSLIRLRMELIQADDEHALYEGTTRIQLRAARDLVQKALTAAGYAQLILFPGKPRPQ